MSEPQACKCCGATEPEVAFRLQPVVLLGRLLVVRGTFCRNCAAAFAETDNWVIRGNVATFDPKLKEESNGEIVAE